MSAQAVGIINVTLSGDCDWAPQSCHRAETRQAPLFLCCVEGVGEGEVFFFVACCLWLWGSVLRAGRTRGWEAPWDVSRPQLLLAAWGGRGLPAAQRRGVRKTGFGFWQAWHDSFGKFQERTWVIKTGTVTERSKRGSLSETNSWKGAALFVAVRLPL